MLKQAEIDRIITLLEDGFTATQISKKTGRSLTTIYRIRDGELPNSYHDKITLPQKIFNYTDFLKTRIFQDKVSNTKRLHQEIKSKGFLGSYSMVKRFIQKEQVAVQSTSKPSRRFETGPGDQAQVDWGTVSKININGINTKLHFFVYLLSYSRAVYAEFTINQNLRTLEDCHIHAFRKLGIPKTIVYDNMKTVVLNREKRTDEKDIIHYNPAFIDFAKYYGFQVIACPPYWPRSKGKVESGVKYIKVNFLNGNQSFSSLRELNESLTSWLDNIANLRTHRTTGERPLDRCYREKPYLRFSTDLPEYNTALITTRHSTKDAMIQYRSNFYSVPSQFARRKLLIKENINNGQVNIDIYFEDQVIASHVLVDGKGEWIQKDEHLNQPKKETHNLTTQSSIPKKQINPAKEKMSELLNVPTRSVNYYQKLIT